MGLKQVARTAMEEAGVPILPGSKGILKQPGRSPGTGGTNRLSGDAEGLGGRRRARHARGPQRRGTCRTCWRRRRPKPRRRSPTAICTWRSWSKIRATSSFRFWRDQHGNVEDPGRARMLHPAPPSEADRRIAVDGRDSGTAQAHLGTPARRAQGHRLHQRRHRRIPDGRRPAICTSSK